ncbi:MAG: BlaI/MecI/CopY family transcriptional regulator [Ruminococcaceae bacterium]|nr:BlaI/MecI/CopY family transcriptional regulator [Oscillospiraceae bacterium]
MEEIRLGAVEEKFADLIWQYEPIPSGELVKLCAEKLNWKKSTTYTVLRKLCDRGIFINEGGIVKKVITKDEFNSIQSEQFVDTAFKGSLPAFLAAFTKRKSLSEDEISEIQRLINSMKEE